MLRSDDGHVFRKALEIEVRGKRKQGLPNKLWKMEVEKENKSWFGEGECCLCKIVNKT